MLKVTFLGICSNQTLNEETVSLLINSDERLILVDVGPGTVKQIYKAQKRAIDIDCVILTHTHGDHFLGFPYLLFSIYTEQKLGCKRDKPITIIASKETYQASQKILDLLGYPGFNKFPFEFMHWNVDMNNKSEFQADVIGIRTLPVEHSVPNFGVRISSGDSLLAYSSDSIYCPATVELAKDVDLLIHEAMGTIEMKKAKGKHGYVDDAAETAKEANAKSLALVHLFPSIVSTPDIIVNQAQSIFNGHVFVPETLQSFEI